MPDVLHITPWLSRKGGGIPPVAWALANENHRQGFGSTVAGLKDEFIRDDIKGKDVSIILGRISGPKSFGYSPDLQLLCESRLGARGIVHSHGLWMHPGIIARRICSKSRFKSVISPHGMLEPWALQNSRWKKKLAGFFFENRNLKSADCLHALCKAEALNFRQYGLKNPIAIIPNGVDLEANPGLPDNEPIAVRWPTLGKKKTVLFLSRLHPKKGLPNLLRAWNGLISGFKGWHLVMAGPDELGHQSELETMVRDLEIESSVLFTGPVYGQEKMNLLLGADVFVLPSFSEGFSMAILEAAASSLPVLFTKPCNFPELASSSAGIEVCANEESIKAGLRQLLEMSDEQREVMGGRGLELVRRSFTWKSVGDKMTLLYEWLLGNEQLPDFVRLDSI